MPVDGLNRSDLSERLIFMSVPAGLGLKEQSFEELRIADYLKAYIATGKPPLPCPPLPTNDHERIELGLPPLFKPHEVGPSAFTGAILPDSPGGTHSGGGRAPSILDTGSLPTVQVFQAVRVGGGGGVEVYQSLASQPEFLNFSHEELRCNAYAKGSIYPPTPLPLDQSPASTLPGQTHSPVVPRPTSPNLPNPAEDIQSLSAAKPYSHHSVEELRVAFIQARRELTSGEIFQLKTPITTASTALSQSPLFAPTGGIFSPPARPS